MKCGELTKRAERRQEAENKLAEAKEAQDMENISKFNKRVVRVTRQHNDDCKKLLQLMGLPIIESPSEAEAQCAQLCKEGLVYATATEDMDGLTFGSPRLVRNLTTGNNEKVKEYYLDKVLSGLGITHSQFIDLGILMGCDYCESIKGIGGKKGLELIKKFGSIEQILEKKFGINEFIDVDVDYGDRKEVEVIDESEANGSVDNNEELVQNNGDRKETEVIDESEANGSVDNNEESVQNSGDSQAIEESQVIDDSQPIDESTQMDSEEENESENDEEIDKNKKKKKSKDKKGSGVPENWLFIGARKLFLKPNVLEGKIQESDLKQKDVDEEALVQFLCVENGFSDDRVRNALKRVKEAKGKCSQTRIDSFFKMMPNTNTNSKNDKSQNDKKNNKRTAPQSKNSGNKRGRKPK